MKAFTLIETMIAITILMLVATGIIFSVGNSLRTSAGSDAIIQAQLLAEEGVELVRAIKDSNVLQQKSIFQNITRSGTSTTQDMCATACYIDDTDPSGIPQLIDPTNDNIPAVSPSTGGEWFSQTKDSVVFNRVFTRTIQAVEVPNGIKVTSTVTYPGQVNEDGIIYTTLLTKWYEN